MLSPVNVRKGGYKSSGGVDREDPRAGRRDERVAGHLTSAGRIGGRYFEDCHEAESSPRSSTACTGCATEVSIELLERAASGATPPAR
jgi:hypothetical protein